VARHGLELAHERSGVGDERQRDKLALLDRQSVAIVGARNASAAACRFGTRPSGRAIGVEIDPLRTAAARRSLNAATAGAIKEYQCATTATATRDLVKPPRCPTTLPPRCSK